MSDPEVKAENVENDPDAAMREMMGFSSFNEQLKNKAKTTSKKSKKQPSSATGANSVVMSNKTSTSDSTTTTPRPDQSTRDIPTANPSVSTLYLSTYEEPRRTPDYAFTAPESGISFTKQELDDLARGKINARGDKVYFKPGFVVENPWFRLK